MASSDNDVPSFFTAKVNFVVGSLAEAHVAWCQVFMSCLLCSWYSHHEFVYCQLACFAGIRWIGDRERELDTENSQPHTHNGPTQKYQRPQSVPAKIQTLSFVLLTPKRACTDLPLAVLYFEPFPSPRPLIPFPASAITASGLVLFCNCA